MSEKKTWEEYVLEAEAALVAADDALDDITGWSGGSGTQCAGRLCVGAGDRKTVPQAGGTPSCRHA